MGCWRNRSLCASAVLVCEAPTGSGGDGENAEPNRMMLDDSGSDDTGMYPGPGTGFDPGALVVHGEPPGPLSAPLPKPKTGRKGACTGTTLRRRPEHSCGAWVVG